LIGALRVTVPATSANLGPGFDSLAVALSLHNTIQFDVAETGVSVRSRGEGSSTLPSDGENLVAQAFYTAFRHLDRQPPGLRIEASNRIPLGSGLGSSAAAVVAGLLAANQLASTPLSAGDLLALAAELEGHADNAAAALTGGLCLVRRHDSGYHIHSLAYRPLKLIVVVPAVDRPTREMRRALPTEVPLADAAVNAANLGLLLHGLQTGDFELIGLGAVDTLHEPYRIPLIPGAAEAIAAGRQAGAAAVVLSGAGPSLLAFSPRNHEAVAQAMEDAFKASGQQARHFLLDIESEGAKVEVLGG
jgi:homoserine kinase